MLHTDHITCFFIPSNLTNIEQRGVPLGYPRATPQGIPSGNPWGYPRG